MTQLHVIFTALELCFLRMKAAVAQCSRVLQEPAHPQGGKSWQLSALAAELLAHQYFLGD